METVQSVVITVASLISILLEVSSLSPFIIVPGCGGSRLHGVLNKDSKALVRRICDSKDKHVDLWPSPAVALPAIVDCWVDNIQLHFNETTGKSDNAPGVNVTVPGFGKTEIIEYLSEAKVAAAKYFYFFVQHALYWGYTRGETLKAAPYDFRHSPHEQDEYFTKLKTMVEEMYAAAGNEKVSVLGHSLGNLYLLYFLQHQPQEWKDKYIKYYFAIGAPFGGSALALKALATGYTLNKSILPHLKLREAERTWPCMVSMLPKKSVWGEHEPLVVTNGKMYTVNDYEAFYNDIGFPDGLQIYNAAKDAIDETRGPGVEVYCIVGTGKATAGAIKYTKGKFPNKMPKDLPEDGDGTVVTRSANLCLGWNVTQSQPIHYQEFEAEHLQLVKDLNVINYIKSALFPEL